MDNFPITLTEIAKEMISETWVSENLEGKVLRVAILGGGCSGYTYGLDFDEEADPEDLIKDFDNFQVAIDPNSASMLSGTEIDYVKTLTQSGFVFNNPNAQRTCGCGKSFS